jgi:hypothetical protein
MSEATKFTPGPWRANRNDFYWEIQSEAHGQIGDACASNVIFVDGVEMAQADAFVIAEANARLMAAAPDMLTALKEVVASLSGRVHSTPALSALVKAELVIAKAEGTQP